MGSGDSGAGGTVAQNHAASNGYAGGTVSITNGSNAVSGAVIESCRSLAIAGMSGFIALRTRKSSCGISGAITIGSGLALAEGAADCALVIVGQDEPLRGLCCFEWLC